MLNNHRLIIKINKMKLLDCTIRDGGYYTNWDFDKTLVKTYIQSMNKLPVDYIEIGYRSKTMEGYLGEYFYCPEYVLNYFKKNCEKKITIILNEKDVSVEDLKPLLQPCIGIVTLVRLAIDPKNFTRALLLAEKVKEMGFEVGFNVMYMSTWKSEPEFLAQLNKTTGICDYFYMVDSFGGVYPEDVKEIYQIVSEQVTVPIGFHGHNNLELALINTLTALECGATIVDATITGIGRGAGNLKTELLLTALNAKNNLSVDFNALSTTVAQFTELQSKYNWGINLPYMVSGANSLPQKEVMDWVGKRFYSYNSIILALANRSKGIKDNIKFDKFTVADDEKVAKAIIVGGGNTVMKHQEAILSYLNANNDVIIIHASSRNVSIFRDLECIQCFCLQGNEGHRLENEYDDFMSFKGKIILPPYPRTMGTYVPEQLFKNSFELSEINFAKKHVDTHTAIALQCAFEFGVKEIEMIGYDGYSGVSLGNKEFDLFKENNYLFEEASNNIILTSLTPTSYSGLVQSSIYMRLN